ncbi:GNAT family N-acetyltransferase [Atopobacter phocae]|uniref:GNAT family N-acetyltransferase n=1 Tax=Atopobacter phocae TaxID=136492 RepID=UPI000471D95C|nr:GNAT family protein [Atopobacter phocae]
MTESQAIVFREAGPNDASRLLQFSRQIGEESDNLSYGSEGLPYSPAFLSQVITDSSDSRYQLWLLACLEETDEIVGQVVIGHINESRIAHIGELGLAVSAEYWGQGIGQALLEEAIYWFETYSALERLELRVLSINEAAKHLYLKMGFEIEGQLKKISRINDRFVDGVLMSYIRK